jgi:hypothetical protein
MCVDTLHKGENDDDDNINNNYYYYYYYCYYYFHRDYNHPTDFVYSIADFNGEGQPALRYLAEKDACSYSK